MRPCKAWRNYTLSFQRIRSHNTNPLKERRERENAKDKKEAYYLCQLKSIGPSVKTRQSHTIKYMFSKIVSHRYFY